LMWYPANSEPYNVPFCSPYVIHIVDAGQDVTAAAPEGPATPVLDSINLPTWFAYNTRVLHVGLKNCNITWSPVSPAIDHNTQQYEGLSEGVVNLPRLRRRIRKDEKLILTLGDAHYHRQSGAMLVFSRSLLRTGLR